MYTQTQLGMMITSSLGSFPTYSVASIEGMNESCLGSRAPDLGIFLLTTGRGLASGHRVDFLEQVGRDLQQAQGAEPLEG